MLFISYICYGGSYPRPKGRVLATAYLSMPARLSRYYRMKKARASGPFLFRAFSYSIVSFLFVSAFFSFTGMVRRPSTNVGFIDSTSRPPRSGLNVMR